MKTLGDRFWDIIEGTVNRDPDRQLQALEAALSNLSNDELVAFEHDFQRLSNAAYRWDLWGAAYVINGGCSDDGFMDFRYWLIAQSKAVYEAARADPESLADHIWEDFASFEEFAYVAQEIYQDRTENEIPALDEESPGEPEGQPWEEDDLEALFPRLTARVAELEKG